jgi:hypothetical protein
MGEEGATGPTVAGRRRCPRVASLRSATWGYNPLEGKGSVVFVFIHLWT